MKKALLSFWRARKGSAQGLKPWLDLHKHADVGDLIYLNCQQTKNRVELSQGTRRAEKYETSGQGNGLTYQDGAMLPRLPWRALASEESSKFLVGQEQSDLANSVSIVRLPATFTEETRRAFWNSDKSNRAEIRRLLETVCHLGDPLHWIGAGQSPANLKTITIEDRRRRCHVGLHVDSWDGLNIKTLDRAMNRICLNIGQADRYFLFLPISLVGIARFLAKEFGDQPKVDHIAMARLFMEKFPQVPVVRCRLAPGEAYIAPTENLVHDGSSEGQSSYDETFVVRGRIEPH